MIDDDGGSDENDDGDDGGEVPTTMMTMKRSMVVMPMVLTTYFDVLSHLDFRFRMSRKEKASRTKQIQLE